MAENGGGPLEGTLVVERSGRLSGGACSMLLLQLGARVVRFEQPGEALPLALEGAAAANLAAFLRAGRERLKYDPDEFRRWLDRADVAISAPPQGPRAPEVEWIRARSGRLIGCIFTPYGLDAQPPERPEDDGELELQAVGGLMATTGEQQGPPLPNGAPLGEMCAGINAAAAVLAALRCRERDGGGRTIDVAVFDALMAMMGTFMPMVIAGKRDGFRQGCRHPLAAPWNVFPTADGRAIVCTTTDTHWKRILELAGRHDLLGEPAYASAGKRVAHVAEVDRIVSGWTRGLTTDALTAALTEAGVPVGALLTIPDLMRDPGFLARDMVRCVEDEEGRKLTLAGPVFHMSRMKPHFPGRVEPLRLAASPPEAACARLSGAQPPTVAASLTPAAALPLAGLRVVEVGSYTAGPMSARNLASLGAGVTKVESLEGEPARGWDPKCDGIGHYFANCNCDKRSLALDLKQARGRSVFLRLCGRADVFIENTRPGTLERLGVGYAALERINPRLIYYGLSGYGAGGERAQKAAYDTVIQAEAGLMSLVHPDVPVKLGVSIADLMGAAFAPVAILAALKERERTGKGQRIDASMQDCTAWLTQFSWPEGESGLPPWCRIDARDGYVLVIEKPERVEAVLPRTAWPTWSCAQALARLKESGLRAARIEELPDVLFGAHVARRQLLPERPGRQGRPVRVLAPPYRLEGMPARLERPIGGVGADGEEVLAEVGYGAEEIAALRRDGVIG